MTESTPSSRELGLSSALDVPAEGPLVERVSAMVEQARAFVATQTNVALTMLYWEIGRLIEVEVLKQERAEYAQQIVGSLAPQLTARFGRGFDRSNASHGQVGPGLPRSRDCGVAGPTVELDPSHDALAGAVRRGACLLHRAGRLQSD